MDKHAQRLAIDKQIQALLRLRKDTDESFQELGREIHSIRRQSDQLSMTIDMAAAVAGPVAVGSKQIFTNLYKFEKGLIGVAQAQKGVLKAVVGRTYGVGALPQSQGLLQSGGQTILGATGVLHPDARDGMLLAFGKILAQTFIDMWSPSFWAKKIGGDPAAACSRADQLNRDMHRKSLEAIDKRIERLKRLRQAVLDGLDISRLA